MLLQMNFNSYQLVLQCSSQTPVTICNIQKNRIHVSLHCHGSVNILTTPYSSGWFWLYYFTKPSISSTISIRAITPSTLSDQSDTNYHNDHFFTPVVHRPINEHLMNNVPEAHINLVPLPLPAIPPSWATALPISSSASAVSKLLRLLK